MNVQLRSLPCWLGAKGPSLPIQKAWCLYLEGCSPWGHSVRQALATKQQYRAAKEHFQKELTCETDSRGGGVCSDSGNSDRCSVTT